MSRPAVADFVDAFFTQILFRPDDALARSVLTNELAPDAVISINGNSLTSAEFTNLITTQFRGGFHARVIEIKDLNIVSTNEIGSTGVVGQWTAYVTTGKENGDEIKQSATTIVKVEEREGKQVISGLWEAQTADQS